MNRDELLTKLAMELEEWPSAGKADWITPDDGSQWYGKGMLRFVGEKLIAGDLDAGATEVVADRKGWLQRRTELINRPSWNDAPQWAQWLAQDEDGEWWWHQEEPELSHEEGCFDSGGRLESICAGIDDIAGHDWRDTLEPRPQAWDRDKAITDLAVAMSPDNWLEGRTVHHKGYTITWEEYVSRRHELEEEVTVEPWPEERMDAIGANGPTGDHYAEDLGYVGRESRELDKAMRHAVASGLAYPDPQLTKQVRYRDSEGEDWIDEFARTATPEEFRGAMRFTVGKYVRRVGRKDKELSEVRKMRDYCQRWEDYLAGMEDEE